MASVFDVADYILKVLGSVTAMKLQKLVYYSQAWSLVWDEKPIFTETIEAWANGPVCVELYNVHKGQFKISSLQEGNSDNLNLVEKETIDGVLKFYKDKSSQWLSDLTHQEDPWIQARKGLAPGQRGNVTITHASMAEYYEGL